jgi:hypothetical protein
MIEDYISDKHVKGVCKIGQKTKTCRFLTISQAGWSCEKSTVLGKFLNSRAEKMAQIARGIGCEGRKPRYVGERQ